MHKLTGICDGFAQVMRNAVRGCFQWTADRAYNISRMPEKEVRRRAVTFHNWVLWPIAMTIIAHRIYTSDHPAPMAAPTPNQCLNAFTGTLAWSDVCRWSDAHGPSTVAQSLSENAWSFLRWRGIPCRAICNLVVYIHLTSYVWLNGVCMWLPLTRASAAVDQLLRRGITVCDNLDRKARNRRLVALLRPTLKDLSESGRRLPDGVVDIVQSLSLEPPLEPPEPTSDVLSGPT